MSDKPKRVWLITGADKGLGFQTAKTALEAGDCVIVTVLAADGSHSLAQAYPDRFRALHLNAADHARIGPVVAEAEAAFGRIDVLVNNAGYGLVSLAEATGAEKYRPLFEVNFFGVTEMTRAVLPIMRRQRSGLIINIASFAGFIGTPGFSFYAATKFAVEGYSEALSKEVKHLGIRVTLVEPGGFRSDFAGPSIVKGMDTLGGDYGEVAEFVGSYTDRRHGKQVNDPELFGQAMLAVADAADPPMRIPFGQDAWNLIQDEIKSVSAELDSWKDVSFSTTRPL